MATREIYEVVLNNPAAEAKELFTIYYCVCQRIKHASRHDKLTGIAVTIANYNWLSSWQLVRIPTQYVDPGGGI